MKILYFHLKQHYPKKGKVNNLKKWKKKCPIYNFAEKKHACLLTLSYVKSLKDML